MKKCGRVSKILLTGVMMGLITVTAHAQTVEPVMMYRLTSFADFQEKMKSVQAKTTITVLVPSVLPLDTHPEKEIVFIGAETKKTRYRIALTSSEDCSWVGSCLNASFQGSMQPFHPAHDIYEQQKPVPMTLKNGDQGYYYESICYTGCSTYDITFKHGQFYYDVAVAGSLTKNPKQEMIDFVNTFK